MFIRIRQRQKEKGNILFFILLAVILFAALSYAVTQSIRGGGKDASNEETSTQAIELLNYFSQIDTAVQRMMVTGNIQDYQVNFFNSAANAFVLGNYDNTNCATNNCRVFNPAGGAVTGRVFPQFIRPGGAATTGTARVVLASVTGAGTALPDLVFTYYSMNKNLCRDINLRMNLDEYIYGGVSFNSTTGLYFYSPYPSGPFPNSTVNINVPQNAGIAGTFCLCAAGSTPDTCDTIDAFYPAIVHVVIAR